VTLYPYQEIGADFLASRDRAYLADGMGLGKTAQAAAAASRVGARRALVIAPASALANWEREWLRWAPEVEMQVISFDRAMRYPGDYHGARYDVVIVDEAHYVKTPTAKRTRAVLRIAAQCRRSWLLSGTPMPNHAGELYAPLRALWPDVMEQEGAKTYEQWVRRFCHFTPSPWGIKVYGLKDKARLRSILRRVMMRRSLDQIGHQLPPLRIDVSLLPQDDQLDAALQDVGLDADELLGSMEREGGETGSLSRLRRLLGTYKAPRIAAILADELRERQYEKIVVLAYHHTTLDLLRRELGRFGVVGFDGHTPPVERQRAIDAFWEDPTARVFVAQQTAAGVAINLQLATEVVLVEPAWSPDENLQAIKRIHRIGQTSPCRARIFAVAGTLDEGIMQVTARKARMQADAGL
jgi:SWI/SNF-related matrix-associated actin-dependent regulator of chromatin subfamily A-like protein 1